MKIKKNTKTAAVITAHPDDETLWAGGTILQKTDWNWFIVCLSRSQDVDRGKRFKKALKRLNASGVMGNMNDSTDLKPICEAEVENAILALMPRKHFNIILSHNPKGEYTRHLRHEEAGKAVIKLWQAGKIFTEVLLVFAYDDENKKQYPEAMPNASVYEELPSSIWQKKYKIISEIYGFAKNSWEAKTYTVASSITTERITRYNIFRRSYETYYHDVLHPGYSESYVIERRAIDVWMINNEEKIIWSATSNSPERNSLSAVQIDIADLVMPELIRSSIIKKTK